jgi:bifunctional DNA-binding transcriptional regulator/antitoxin component of YhaV-PrlF toxin-antitoxin module
MNSLTVERVIKMTELELVKMSAKGQLVVPDSIRREERFEPGDRFVPVPVKEGVLFKRIKIPNIKVEFAKLAKELEIKFKTENVTPKTVDEAVKWTRRASS